MGTAPGPYGVERLTKGHGWESLGEVPSEDAAKQWVERLTSLDRQRRQYRAVLVICTGGSNAPAPETRPSFPPRSGAKGA